METDVAAALDDDAFHQRNDFPGHDFAYETLDQHHDDPQMQNSSHGGLGESVSFGRFSSDSLSWVKRSSFNHNQYLEEVGSCSTPGSVRQKKAYFEAYYKAIAKRKAMEKALAEGNLDEQSFEDGDNGSYDDEKGQEHLSTTTTTTTTDILDAAITSASSTADAGDWLENQSVESLRQGENNGCGLTQNAENSGELNVGVPGGSNAEEQEYNVQGSPRVSNDGGAPAMPDKISSEMFENEAQLTEVTREGANEEAAVLTAGVDEFREQDIHSLQDEKQDLVPQFLSSMHSDGTKEAEIVDKFETKGIPVHQPSDLKESPDEHEDLKVSRSKKVSNEKISQTSAQKTNAKSSSATVSASDSVAKLRRRNVSRQQGPGVMGEMKGHPRPMNTGNSHSNITVPQPFALATDKRASLTGEQDGTKLVRKPARKGSVQYSPASKRTQASVKSEKKHSGSKSLAGESMKQQQESEQGSNSQKLERDDSEAQSEALPAQPENDGKGEATQVKFNTNTFSFKSDERAEKRKEFNSKLEARWSAKEAEKSQAEAKTQEEAEEEIKQLRKSLKFKATPMPNFYQEPTQPKLDAKKVRVPSTRPKSPTRAKSPKLGRKSSGVIGENDSNSAKPSAVSMLKQVKGSTPSQQNPAKVTEIPNDSLRSRIALATSKKTTKKSCSTTLQAENPRTRPVGVRQSGKLLDAENPSSSPVSCPCDIHWEKTCCLSESASLDVPDDRSNRDGTASAPNGTVQVNGDQLVESSSGNTKSVDSKRAGQSPNQVTSLEGLQDDLQDLSSNTPSRMNGNEYAAAIESSNQVAAARPKKGLRQQNGAPGGKRKGEVTPKRERTKSSTATVANSKRDPVDSGSNLSMKNSESILA